MEIFVLVKQVPDPEAIVKVKSDTELEIENKYFTNFFDEIGVEAGLKLKEKFGGKVTVLTLDNRRVDALRRGISMGADEAIQILAGRQAMDDDAGIVGPAVAELLGIPHTNAIVGLEVDDPKGVAKVTREVENGKEILSCPLPAIFTCQKGLNTPRIPLVMNVMKAMKTQIKKLDLAALGLTPSDVGSSAAQVKVQKYLPSPKRPPLKMIKEDFPENVKMLVKLLKEEAKVI
jgi:electron transfer flavoprotein beta subunit